ncbi:MAG: hypothetical protein JRN18_01165 [Nitrososphaerota archaeon]|nr:hypothetical protein [Nitrososphaerota archaeon]
MGDEFYPTVNYGTYSHKSYTSERVIRTMTFPTGDASEIELTCPHCEARLEFKNENLMHPAYVLELEQKDMMAEAKMANPDSMEELRREAKALQSEKESLSSQLTEQKVEIQRLRNNNDKLAEDNSILSHALQDLMTRKEKDGLGGN